MPQRLRVHGDIPYHILPLPKWTSLNGTLIQDWGQWSGFRNLMVFPKHISYMLDVVGNQGAFNPCDHFELYSTMSNMNPWVSSTGDPRHVNFDGVAFPMLLPAGSFKDWPWLPEFPAASLSDWSVEAYNKFHDQVPVTVSLPNFMYELKDMKGMIPSIDRLSVSKTVSNNFLAFEFGVLPFISDIKAILSMSDSVQKRLQHLLMEQGKSSRLSFSRDIDVSDAFSFTKSLYLIGSSANDNDVQFRRTSAKASFHCGAKLFQDLQGLNDALSTLKALSASGGFNHPARVIWNAIPYSFVVDWFFHVGKLLDSLSVQPFGGEYSLSEIGYSLTREAVFIADQVLHDGATELRSSLGTVSVKSYSRKTGFPVSSLFLTNGILSPMQLALSSAMLNQRRG